MTGHARSDRLVRSIQFELAVVVIILAWWHPGGSTQPLRFENQRRRTTGNAKRSRAFSSLS
jgi:hypothetical protein